MMKDKEQVSVEKIDSVMKVEEKKELLEEEKKSAEKKESSLAGKESSVEGKESLIEGKELSVEGKESSIDRKELSVKEEKDEKKELPKSMVEKEGLTKSEEIALVMKGEANERTGNHDGAPEVTEADQVVRV